MNVEVSSPEVESCLKEKTISLYQSICRPDKYAGFVSLSKETISSSDFVFVVDLEKESPQSLFYDVSHPQFKTIMKDLQNNPSKEWMEIAKCNTVAIHSVLIKLVEHIEETTNKKPDFLI